VSRLVGSEMCIRDRFNAMRNDVETGVLQNRLSEIKQPIGLLWCDQDQIVDASASAIFAKGLVNHTALTLKKCGHMPMMEQPNPVAEFLLQQLN
jgi:pimeloyl-ACP methyl ester carboxylesterase